MKNTVLKAFTLILLFIVGFTSVSSVYRPMTSVEQDAFVGDLTEWVNRYAEKNFEPLKLKLSPVDLELKVAKDIDGWNKRTEVFDRLKKLGSGKPWVDRLDESILKFGDALREYHDYISRGFALNCRGLSSYVFKKLRDLGFKCRYAKIHFNPFSKNSHFIVRQLQLHRLPQTKDNVVAIMQKFRVAGITDFHDVVVYDTDHGPYVCDFTSAAISYLKYRFGSEETKKDMVSFNLGSEDMSYLMKIPLKDYRNFMVDDSSVMVNKSPDGKYYSLACDPFQELDVERNPELLDQRSCVVYDHFREITEDKYCQIVGKKA